MKPIAAQDFLWNPAKTPVPDVCAVFGEEHFLKTRAAQVLRDQVLAGEDAEFSLSRYEGKSASIEAVVKELATPSMFGSNRRFVVIDDADPFVTKCRAELESYSEKPSSRAVLLLLLKTFASNTRLSKILAETGLIIDAKPLDEKIHRYTGCKPIQTDLFGRRGKNTHG